MSTTDDWELRFQGAESRIWFGKYKGEIAAVKKERFAKKYRAVQLDERLTKERIRAEVRAIKKIKEKCKELGKLMPDILEVNDREIVMSQIEDGMSVCEYMRKHKEELQQLDNTLRDIGKVIAQIHTCGLIHGDLTTSNFIISKGKIIPIDFGLSTTSASCEDRAVDLYVLERALLSTFVDVNFDEVLAAYDNGMAATVGKDVLKKLDEVRMRGRKRNMVG